MPLNCENKVDSKSVCIEVKKQGTKERKGKRARALKSICDSDAMLNASCALCSIIFSMFTGFISLFLVFNMQYAHPNRS